MNQTNAHKRCIVLVCDSGKLYGSTSTVGSGQYPGSQRGNATQPCQQTLRPREEGERFAGAWQRQTQVWRASTSAAVLLLSICLCARAIDMLNCADYDMSLIYTWHVRYVKPARKAAFVIPFCVASSYALKDMRWPARKHTDRTIDSRDYGKAVREIHADATGGRGHEGRSARGHKVRLVARQCNAGTQTGAETLQVVMSCLRSRVV